MKNILSHFIDKSATVKILAWYRTDDSELFIPLTIQMPAAYVRHYVE